VAAVGRGCLGTVESGIRGGAMLQTANPAGGQAEPGYKKMNHDLDYGADSAESQENPFLSPIPENIPEELKLLDQWVCWRFELNKDGKKTKVPYHPSGFKADCSKPNSWTSFDQAWAGYQSGKYDGIGFEFSHDDPFAGVDLDHCINNDGSLEAWAISIVERLNSYTEKSPSGTGLHIFIKAKLPPGGRKKGYFECYESGRYLTVTGVLYES